MKESLEKYQGKTRLRACGVLIQENRILLIRHKRIGKKGLLWVPPGGGVEYQEPVEQTIKREFLEETSLNVEVNDFLFANEYIDDQLHAVELFFSVKRLSGTIKLGQDPEHSSQNQLIDAIDWFSEEKIRNMDKFELHNAFWPVTQGKSIQELSGFFKFRNISVG